MAAAVINAPTVLTVRCHHCQKQRRAFEVVTTSANTVMCFHCREWHMKALLAFAGKIPDGCQGCGRSYADLEAVSLNGDVKFAFVPKDGIYQILCAFCSPGYLEKRTELFKGTAYGRKVLKV